MGLFNRKITKTELEKRAIHCYKKETGDMVKFIVVDNKKLHDKIQRSELAVVTPWFNFPYMIVSVNEGCVYNWIRCCVDVFDAKYSLSFPKQFDKNGEMVIWEENEPALIRNTLNHYGFNKLALWDSYKTKIMVGNDAGEVINSHPLPCILTKDGKVKPMKEINEEDAMKVFLMRLEQNTQIK